MFRKSKSNKSKLDKQKAHLASLGLDPSLFDDPVDDQDMSSDFPSESVDIPKLGEDDEDINVELDPEDLEEGSELSKELASLTELVTGKPKKELTVEEKISQLEKQISNETATANLYKTQGFTEEAKEVDRLILDLTKELNQLKGKTVNPNLPQQQQQQQQQQKQSLLPTQQDTVKSTNQPPSPSIQKPTSSLYGDIDLSPEQPVMNSYDVDYLTKSPSYNNPETKKNSNSVNQETTLVKTVVEDKSHSKPQIPKEQPTKTSENIQSAPKQNHTEDIKFVTKKIDELEIALTEEDLEKELMTLGEDPKKILIKQKLEECEKYRPQCLAVALKYKNQGDKESALEWLRCAKMFEAAKNFLLNGEDTDISELVAKVHAQYLSPVQSVQPKQVPVKSPVIDQQREERRIAAFVELETKLQTQIQDWMERAVKYKNEGERALAVKYFGEKKKMSEDLLLIQKAKQTPGVPLPEFTIEPYIHQSEIHFRNRLAADELEIAVVNATDLAPPSGVSQVDSYVTIFCPFASSEPLQVKTKKVSSTNSPAYKEVAVFKYDRNKRTFIKMVERKKIVFEVFHSRWLRGDVSLGKCELLISDIKSKAEIKKELPILINGRKDSGGRLNVRIRLCYPLEKKHIVEEKATMIVIQKHCSESEAFRAPDPLPEKHTQSTPSITSTRTTQTESPQKPKSDNVPNPVKHQADSAPSVNATKANAAPTSNTQPKPTKQIAKTDDDEEIDYNPVENMISNDVLEWAQENVEKEIASYTAKRQPVPEDLITRKQQIEVKLQVLMIQVQTGIISEEVYVENIKAKIEQEKNLARQYMAQKNEQGAKLALVRSKIMTKELEG